MPERVSGPPPLDAARRSTFEPRGSFLLAGAALQALDGARARFGAPPFDAARRSTFEPRGSFLLAGAALQALECARACSGPPPPRCCQAQHFGASRLVSAGRGSTSAPLLDSARRSTWEPGGSGSGVVAARARTFSQFKLGARRPFLPPLPALAFERCCKPSGLLVSASA